MTYWQYKPGSPAAIKVAGKTILTTNNAAAFYICSVMNEVEGVAVEQVHQYLKEFGENDLLRDFDKLVKHINLGTAKQRAIG